jgi:hypothetical protein
MDEVSTAFGRSGLRRNLQRPASTVSSTKVAPQTESAQSIDTSIHTSDKVGGQKYRYLNPYFRQGWGPKVSIPQIHTSDEIGGATKVPLQAVSAKSIDTLLVIHTSDEVGGKIYRYPNPYGVLRTRLRAKVSIP